MDGQPHFFLLVQDASDGYVRCQPQRGSKAPRPAKLTREDLWLRALFGGSKARN